MSSIPSNLARVPNALSSRLGLSAINRSNVELLIAQQQLATGRSIQRMSDDIVKAAAIGVLDDRLERSGQLQRNLSHADASLNVLDSILEEATDAAREARGIAGDQLSLTTSPTERLGQATVVDQILAGMFNTANRQSVAGFALGGTITSGQPVGEFFGYYRYRGAGNVGLTTDLGLASNVPITLGTGNPLTGAATRLRGLVDLDPRLTDGTRLSELGGARGQGIASGPVQFSFAGGAPVQVDLSGSDTLRDITTRLTAAIRQYETDQGVTILGPGGVALSGGAISIDVVGGSPAPALEFFEVGAGTAARDLGLTDDAGSVAFTNSSAVGVDTRPALTFRTPLSALAGLSGALGQIKISNAGRSSVVNLSGAQTLGDVKNLIESANMGVEVVISEDGSAIDIVNQVSAGSTGALSIEEVAGQGLTATRLGIRSMSEERSLADFNFGKGVGIIDGRTNPTTGLIDPALNTDLRITLGDAARTTIDIDLRPQDVTTVGALVARINAEAAPQLAAAGLPASALVAGLTDGANGLTFAQDPSFTAGIQVNALNNSPAADRLGLLRGTYDTATSTLRAEDRSRVRVESVFSDLVDLRDSLRANDTFGISFAGEKLEQSIGSLAEVRGLVGGYGQRVESAISRESDRTVQDEATRSELRDADFTAVATRISLLQTQLQAAYQTAASNQSRSLLDFLGG
jgi:flagellin-like hook-associated protein FlgL